MREKFLVFKVTHVVVIGYDRLGKLMHSGAMVRPGEEGALLSLLVVKSLVAAVDKQDSSVQDSRAASLSGVCGSCFISSEALWQVTPVGRRKPKLPLNVRR